MKKNKKLQVLKYLTGDWVTAITSWLLFFIYRKTSIESRKFGTEVPLDFDSTFYTSLIIIPLFWMSLYFFTGTYKAVYRKSRIKEIGQTFLISVIGVLIIFFVLILDDTIIDYKSYYASVSTLFYVHFLLTAFVRFIFSSITNHRIHNKIIGFNTLLVGGNEQALKLYQDMDEQVKSSGNLFVGFVDVDKQHSEAMRNRLPYLGQINQISDIIQKYEIEEVIIAIESSEHKSIGKIINELDDTRIIIKIIPDMYDILSGSVKMTSIFGAPLIEVSREIMTTWEKSVKRLFDVALSLFVLTCFSWLYLIVSIIIKATSRGPIFYSHERIGIHGKPFMIHKFRSMYSDAEKNGPALSSKHDPRITPFGRFLRKVRLDEIPQFYNVLIGEMSIVGPRPERQYFIDQIMKKAPHYKHLHKVKPGITSWGQVKYGYAENVEEMIERLKYDVIYIENMSLMVDFKILFYTILIVLQGRGK